MSSKYAHTQGSCVAAAAPGKDLITPSAREEMLIILKFFELTGGSRPERMSHKVLGKLCQCLALAIILVMSGGALGFQLLRVHTQSQMTSNNCHLKLSKLKACGDNGRENKRLGC